MTQEWQIEGPKVLDIGDEHETVSKLKVGLVAGRVDVVTHDDSPTARVEVHEISGRPLYVRWDGTTLRVSHVRDGENNLFEALKSRFGGSASDLSARVSISVPAAAVVSVSTVSADALVGGVRSSVKANTVSGALTLDDLTGAVSANSVSGDVECHQVDGDLSGNTVSGTLTVQASRLDTVRLTTVSGDITLDLTQSRAQIQSNSVSGDVTVRIPRGGGYDVSAHTASGHVVIDGTAMSAGRPGQRGGRLSDGDQALKIKANSVSGDIVVLRSDAGTATGTDADSEMAG